METRRKIPVFPEAMLEDIVARLPLRSVARIKSVCKRWKSVIESSYFRRLFVSLHRNSSSSWSLMPERERVKPIREAMGFYGCKKWDLPKTPASYITPCQRYPDSPPFFIASSSGLVLIGVKVGKVTKCLVGNPVLQQWVEIPPFSHLPRPNPLNHICLTRVHDLVTRVEESGLVSSFKVVVTCLLSGITYLGVFSSETGLWTFKRFGNYCRPSPSMNHNGMLYMWERDDFDTGPGFLLAHDFYASEDDDQSRVIPLPLPYNEHVRRCLTTSREDVFYIEVLNQSLKLWRLKNNNSDGECWQQLREEIDMASLGFDVDCFPMGLNPFDSDIIYLWCQQHGRLVSGNLRTQEFIVHQESENWSSSGGSCVLNTLESKAFVECMCDPTAVLMLSQFVLPQWMDPVPRRPN